MSVVRRSRMPRLNYAVKRTDASEPYITNAHHGGPCRVCGEDIPPLAPALLKAWSVLGISCVSCGFWRPDEKGGAA